MARRNGQTRYAVGMMTGTSLDGLDAALMELTGTGHRLHARLLAHVDRPLGGLAAPLRRAADQQPLVSERFARLALDFGHLHIEAMNALLAHHETKVALDLICVHGQTVFHGPPVSWQLINPTPLAHAAGCPVVYDLRQADLAAGGEGAPITPLADWIMLRDHEKRRAIVNLGGFCNVTMLPAGKATRKPQIERHLEQIQGFDICACNQVLDAVARNALGMQYDKDGQVARAGAINAEAARLLLDLLNKQRHEPRSLGTRDAALAWIDDEAGRLEPADLAATAAATIGECIGTAMSEQPVDEVILAGGGAKHSVLREAIRHSCAHPVRGSDELGLPVQVREAAAMAVLGALCADGVPITLPQVTGCDSPAPVAGAWAFPHGPA